MTRIFEPGLTNVSLGDLDVTGMLIPGTVRFEDDHRPGLVRLLPGPRRDRRCQDVGKRVQCGREDRHLGKHRLRRKGRREVVWS